jgi:hypothetical protein
LYILFVVQVQIELSITNTSITVRSYDISYMTSFIVQKKKKYSTN